MGVDEGNLLVIGVEWYILTSSSYDAEIEYKRIITLGLGSDGCR